VRPRVGAAEVRDHLRPAMGTRDAVARSASIGGNGFCISGATGSESDPEGEEGSAPITAHGVRA
jgi:hypothetical protein